MELQPKTEPGFESNDHRNMKDMSIQELVSVLRTAFTTQDFDSVEEVLVGRDKRLQTEILRLQEMVELEKLTRFQAEEDLRNTKELCERGKRAQNNYEELLKEVKKYTNLADRDIIGDLRKKNKELELEVCELRKLDNSNAVAQLRIRVDVLENDNNALRVKNSELENDKNTFRVKNSELENDNNALRVKNSELEKLIEKNNEAHADHGITDFEDRDEENVGDYEPPSKRCKNAQGAPSPARHENVAEERQENLNVPMSEGIFMIDNVVVPPSSVQKQIVTQRKPKRKMSATHATSNSFDSFHFISLVHQERYSKCLTTREFWSERNFQLKQGKFSDIQAMIVSRGWMKLTSFAKEASITLAKEFFANAYQEPAKENGNKNYRIRYTSFVRGKKVPFHDEIINKLFGLENYKHCSFEARVAKGSNIDFKEVLNTLHRPEINWVRNQDGTPRNKLSYSDLTPTAKAWLKFVSHTLLPCSNVSVGSNMKPSLLLAAIVKGEPVNVGRLLANNLWDTANCSSPMSYIIHASLISKLCERVRVYPKENEEMVNPSRPLMAEQIKKYSIPLDPHRQRNVGFKVCIIEEVK